MTAATAIPRADMQLSPRNTSHIRLDQDNNNAPGKKRKASDSSVGKSHAAAQRQKTTRACDYCKGKKTRCTGTLPCSRCTKLSLPCEYNAAYSRGLPPEPPPGPLSSSTWRTGNGDGAGTPLTRPWTSHHNHTTHTPPSQISARSSPKDSIFSNSQPPSSARDSSGLETRTSPDPVATDLEGNYLGPSSGISFLNRVWQRLHQDESSAITDELQNECSSRNTSVFMFGDKPYSTFQEPGFTLPSYDKARELVDIYFDFAIVTYRFLHRGSVDDWLRQVYENDISFANPPTGKMVARAAIVLMVFAVATLYEEQHPGRSPDDCRSESELWYAASKYMSSTESGPPRLETIQARLGQCLYLLSSSRANECWYAFGTALQLVTALGLHRKLSAKIPKNGSTYFGKELRKRTFWSAYTLDKYLSVMFGRPRLLHDEDIDQELPDEVNDEDILQEDPAKRTGSADCMMIASVFHYKLGRILGEISRQLGTINPHSRGPPLDKVVHLTTELEKWKEHMPPLFNSVRATSLIPPLCRQSQVLQLAYSHAMIHVTRSFLLNDFTDLSRRPPVPNPTVAGIVQKCIGSAEDVIKLVDSLAEQGIMVQSFWFTHYVCFCAIIVVYIYIIQQHRQPSTSPHSSEDPNHLLYLFSLAEACQQHLAEATRKNCPSRRYSIILEELRREVHRQIGSPLQLDSSIGASVSGNIPCKSMQNQDAFIQQSQYVISSTANTVEQSMPLDSSAMNYPPLPGFQESDLTGGAFDTGIEDFGFLENLEGSTWWAQLDSWAFSNPSNEPSMCMF